MKNLMKEIFHKRGKDEYIRKITEELNELACAVSHYVDGKIDSEEVIEEMADVYLQLYKLEMSLVSFNVHLHSKLTDRIQEKFIKKHNNLEKFI